MPSHLAATSPAKGQPLEVQSRSTPRPGPGELLVAVKSVALNPADGIMRDHGLFIPVYPTVIGFDIAGLVLEIGEGVPTSTTDDDQGVSYRPGITRVAAFGGSHWKSWAPDYGAFQERCLVPWQHAVPIKDENLSWNHMATLPVSVATSLVAWDNMGIPRLGAPTGSASVSAGTSVGTQKNRKTKGEALLVWGASSSVGSMGVQSARLLREDQDSDFAAVYATAGSTNQQYVGSLGADRVFDYKDPKVVDAIVSAAKEDGLVIRHCYLATGQLAPCQAVLKSFLGADGEDKKEVKAKIGSAPPVPSDAEVVDGLQTIHVQPSMEQAEKLEQFRYWMGTWLGENLAKGVIRPSPEPQVVGRGLEFINAGLDRVLRGVSCTKLVVEVDE
jgi:NADPH:quinone reductase-like Zn-dependent oxidoreductase